MGFGTRLLGFVLAAACLGSALSGCGGKGSGGGGGSPPKEAVIRYNMGADPRSLDPQLITDLTAMSAASQMFEGLVRITEKGIVAGQAETWDISNDGLTYTFHLRKGLTWSNGDPVTADDFVYAWQRALDPRFGSEYAYQLYYIKNGEQVNTLQPTGYKDPVKKEGPTYDDKAVDAAMKTLGVRAPDPNTLVATLESPTPYFLGLTAFQTLQPVNKKLVTANASWAVKPETYISNGPFMLQTWSHNDQLVMVKNPKYWDAASVKLDKLVYLMIEQASTALNLWETGKLDSMDSPPPPEIPRLRQEGKLKMIPTFGTYYYIFNTTKAPFTDARVRKALAMSIDRKSIVENITRAGQVPAYALVAPGAPDASAGSDFRQTAGALFKEDVAEAKKLLADAGYPDGKGFPDVTLLYNTNEGHKAVAEAIVQMWQQRLGIKVNLTNQEWKTVLDKRSHKDYVLARAGWFGDYLDAMTFMDLYVTGGGNNDTAYGNAAVDALIKQAKTTANQTLRMKAMHDAEKILISDDMVVLPIYFYSQPYLEKDNIKGVYRNNLGILDFKYATVS